MLLSVLCWQAHKHFDAAAAVVVVVRHQHMKCMFTCRSLGEKGEGGKSYYADWFRQRDRKSSGVDLRIRMKNTNRRHMHTRHLSGRVFLTHSIATFETQMLSVLPASWKRIQHLVCAGQPQPSTKCLCHVARRKSKHKHRKPAPAPTVMVMMWCVMCCYCWYKLTASGKCMWMGWKPCRFCSCTFTCCVVQRGDDLSFIWEPFAFHMLLVLARCIDVSMHPTQHRAGDWQEAEREREREAIIMVYTLCVCLQFTILQWIKTDTCWLLYRQTATEARWRTFNAHQQRRIYAQTNAQQRTAHAWLTKVHRLISQLELVN